MLAKEASAGPFLPFLFLAISAYLIIYQPMLIMLTSTKNCLFHWDKLWSVCLELPPDLLHVS